MEGWRVEPRPSRGIPDGQLGAAIGERTGASIVASTHGAIPPNRKRVESMTWTGAGKPSPWIAPPKGAIGPQRLRTLKALPGTGNPDLE